MMAFSPNHMVPIRVRRLVATVADPRRHGNGRNRRILPIFVGSGECPFTEPTTAVGSCNGAGAPRPTFHPLRRGKAVPMRVAPRVSWRNYAASPGSLREHAGNPPVAQGT